MSDDRVDRILDAAYTCFVRHGVRRTTMDDIAAAAEMSRAAVYQYVQNKDDAFRRLATRMFEAALTQARAAASDGSLVDRLHGALAVKLELTLRLMAESPHAEELLGASTRLFADLFDDFGKAMHALLAGAVADAHQRGEVTLVDIEATELADLGLALNAGLDAYLTDPDVLRRRLRQGVELLVGGLARPQPSSPST